MPDTRNTHQSAPGVPGGVAGPVPVTGAERPATSEPRAVPRRSTLPQSGKPELGTEQGTNESRGEYWERMIARDMAQAAQGENTNMRDTGKNSWGEAASPTSNMRDTHENSWGVQPRTEAQNMLRSVKVGLVLCLVIGNLLFASKVVELTQEVEVLKSVSDSSITK